MIRARTWKKDLSELQKAFRELIQAYLALNNNHPHGSIGDYLGHDTAIMNDEAKFYMDNVKDTNLLVGQMEASEGYKSSVGTWRQPTRSFSTA